MKTIFFVYVFFFLNISYAINVGQETGLQLPRYVSVKSDDANLRVGPSKNYPILIKYVIANFPLKIVEEYDDWRRIVDLHNNSGWIHKSLLKGERNGIIISSNKQNIKIYNSEDGKHIGEIAKGTIIKLPKCKNEWCYIIKGNNKGWIEKKYIWGVNEEEIFGFSFLQILINYFYKSVNFIENKFIN